MQAIKSEGGVAFAQDPKSAGYPGMPESAILAGCVDFVLPPEEIARELVRLEHLPYAKRTASMLEVEPPLAGAADLQRIIQILRTATGVDFSLYKTGTIKRRVARRMILHNIESLQRYELYLEQNASEVAALYQDVFIHVTDFFREPETFRGAATEGSPQADREPAAGRTTPHMGSRMLHGRRGVLDCYNAAGIRGETGSGGYCPDFRHRHQCAGG